MTKTGWIAIAVGVIGAGALALFKLGKKAAIPSYQDGTTSFPFDEVTSSTPQSIVEQAEVATEVATKAAAQQAQLAAQKEKLEQQATVVERELNSVLSEQTPGSIAQAQALDVERQSLLSQMAANDAAMTQSVATSDAAQQSIDSATQALLLANEREQVALNAQANAEADRQARELEKARQAQATAELNPKSTSPAEPTTSLPAPTPTQVQSNETKWQQAAQLLIQLWMNDYPKQTTNALRMAWFQKLEAGIAETEKLFPGFSAWLATTHKALLSKMTVEKKKISAEVVGVSPADPKLAVWKTASVLTLDYWTKIYPGQNDVNKAKGLIAIVAATKATEQGAPGYMKWFEATYPGVSAKMMAEGTRLRNVAVAGSDALVTKPTVETKPQVAKEVVTAYNQLVAGWEAYKKLTNEDQRKAVMTATMAASVTPQGKLVWLYAQSVNPSFVAAVTAEATRLAQAPKQGQVGARSVDSKVGVGARSAIDLKVGVGARPLDPKVGVGARPMPVKAGVGARPMSPKAGVGARPVKKENVKVVTDYVAQAKMLRDTAKVLTNTNSTQALANKQLQSVMGR